MAKLDTIRTPGSRNRTAIIGQTESGKTVAALWHLSRQNFTDMPWIVINSKGDEFVDSIEGTSELELDDELPKHPGIYIVRPRPRTDNEALNEMLTRMWKRENNGLLVDEGYMVTGLEAFDWNLVQGRSKRVPMIILSQRPVFMSLFTFSEASFFQVFQLSIKNDKKKIEEYTPITSEDIDSLKKHWSWYYDVGNKQKVLLKPVPDEATIRARIEDRLASIPKRLKRYGT